MQYGNVFFENIIPMQHGKQNHDKTNVFTLEVSLCDFADDTSAVLTLFMILLPMLHGKHIFTYGASAFSAFLCFKAPLAAQSPQRAFQFLL